MLIDSHCHLDMLPDDGREALARAAAAGVGEMVTISVRLSQAAALQRIAERTPGVWCTVGVHPHHAAEEGAVPTPEAIASLAEHPRVVGIGESGLDYFYDTAPRAVQATSFRAHIRAARLAGLPLVVHARDADDDVARILAEEHADGPFAFVLHCFSSGPALAEAGLALGGYLGFTGMLTFPKADAIRAVARDAPADRLLVETDAPYLAPVPNRGRPNEPSFVVHTAARLEELRGLSHEQLAGLTTRNFRTLFSRTA